VRELVALGFEDPVDECITWFELTNVAEDPVGNFFVEPEEVERVLRAAQQEGCDSRSTRILWHSHYRSEQPSEADYQLMRDNPWIDAGIVFHAPTQKSVVYTSAGIISNRAEEQTQLATSNSGGE
jgi:proteasome lid subunit RPN8/RPN11